MYILSVVNSMLLVCTKGSRKICLKKTNCEYPWDILNLAQSIKIDNFFWASLVLNTPRNAIPMDIAQAISTGRALNPVTM